MATRIKRKVVSLPVVEPAKNDPKSGCYHCPLLAYYDRVDDLPGQYQQDPVAIRARLKVPHENKHFNFHGPPDPCDVLVVFPFPPVAKNPLAGQVLGGYHERVMRPVIKFAQEHNIKLGITSLVRCKTPRERDPSKTEIRSCRPELDRELVLRKPKVVVAVGGSVMHHLTEQSGIDTLSGAPMRSTLPGMENVPVVPVISTKQVISFDFEAKRFDEAFDKAFALARGHEVYKQEFGKYRVVETVEEAEEVLDAMSKGGKLVSCDTETGALSPFKRDYPALLCVSVTNEVGRGWTIPVDHEDSPFYVPDQITLDTLRRKADEAYAAYLVYKTKRTSKVNKKGKVRQEEYVNEAKARGVWEKVHDRYMRNVAFRRDMNRRRMRNRIINALRRFMDSDVAKVGQNYKFDIQVLHYVLGSWVNNFTYDTLYTHYAVDDRRGSHGLDKLAHKYTKMGGYDVELERYKKEHPECKESYFNIPGDLLFWYAAVDVDATLQVHKNIRKTEEFEQRRYVLGNYTDFLGSLGYTLGRMEYNGSFVEKERAKLLKIEYANRIERLTMSIRTTPEVARLEATKLYEAKKAKTTGPLTIKEAEGCRFSSSSAKDVRTLLFEVCGYAPVELSDAGLDIISERYDRALQDAEGRGASAEEAENMVSADEILARAIKNKEWNLFSTAAEVLHEIARNTKSELIKQLLELREYYTLYNTFIEPLEDRMDEDGLVHGTFSPTSTETGRLASRNPNMQNLPNKGGLVKCIYTSRFGANGLILTADYSQIELRVAASYFKEPIMVEAYRKGIDLHTMTATTVSKKTKEQYEREEEGKKKRWRTIAKRVNFLIIYGGAGAALSANLKKEGIFYTPEECQEMIDTFLKARPGLVAGIERTQDFARRNGYLEAFTGFRRRLPQVFSSNNSLVRRALRQVINFPIQHAAAYMMLMALCLIDRDIQQLGLKSVLYCTVHDSLNIDCPREEVVQVAGIVKKYMENLPKYIEPIFSGLDWEWLDTPIEAEIEIGDSWGEQFKFEPDHWGKKQDAPLTKEVEGKLRPNRTPVNFAEVDELRRVTKKFNLTAVQTEV